MVFEFKNWTICEAFKQVGRKEDRREGESANMHMARQMRSIWGKNDLGENDYNSIISDFAALTVARCLGFEEEGCQMHNEDKVGQAAIGALTKSKKKVEVDPFPEGVAVLNAMRGWGKHFVYDSRRQELHTACGHVNPPAPPLKITIDHSKTRIASTRNMLTPMVRMHRALKAHRDVMQHPPSSW